MLTLLAIGFSIQRFLLIRWEIVAISENVFFPSLSLSHSRPLFARALFQAIKPFCCCTPTIDYMTTETAENHFSSVYVQLIT